MEKIMDENTPIKVITSEDIPIKEVATDDMSTEKLVPKKVSAYFDGFNIFHAIALFGKRYYRLDYKALARQFTEFGERLGDVYYFTAIYRKDKK
jgi:hypothetical protein